MLLGAELRTPAWTRKVAGSKVACPRGVAGEVPAGGDPRATLSCGIRHGHGRGKDTQRHTGSPGARHGCYGPAHAVWHTGGA